MRLYGICRAVRLQVKWLRQCVRHEAAAMPGKSRAGGFLQVMREPSCHKQWDGQLLRLASAFQYRKLWLR